MYLPKLWRLLFVGVFMMMIVVSPESSPILAQSGLKTDLGDAPDSATSAMTAYTGVQAKFPTLYADTAGTPRSPAGPKHFNRTQQFFLGTTLTHESEADSGTDDDGINNINPKANSANQDGGDDGLKTSIALNHCETITIPVTVNSVATTPTTAYLNVWFDWERDGTWTQITVPQCPDNSRILDWAVQNQAVTLNTAGTQTVFITVKAYNPTPTKEMWVRVTLSNTQAANSDGSGPSAGYVYGETEDYLWPGQTPTPTPTATSTATPDPKPTVGPRPANTTFEILQSDNKQFEVVIRFPALLTDTIVNTDSIYVQLSSPDVPEPPTGDVRTYGKPAIPVIHRLIAIPKGSLTPTIRVSEVVTEVMNNVLLYPLQPSPVDQTAPPNEEYLDFGDRPFQRDEVAYRQDAFMPANPVEVRRIGSIRDLDVVMVSIATGQYNPAKRQLILFPSLKLYIAYQGGEGYFLPGESAATPFENHHVDQHELMLNAKTLPDYPGPAPKLDLAFCVGYEFIIITAPGLRPAADKLATWKWQKGISTHVVEVGNGQGKAGTTPQEIVTYLRNEYNRCQVRPSYVMFLGDSKGSQVVPTWYQSSWEWNSEQEKYVEKVIATDHFYSLMHPSFEGFAQLPEIALGRMPARNLNEAITAVDKVINYEKSPPQKPSFYQNVSIASYFQCCNPTKPDGTTTRGFIETAELVRSYLVNQNYTVQRIYDTDAGFHSDPTDLNSYYPPGRDVTPRFYRLGQAIPNGIQPPFAWNGNKNDLKTAIEAGRFLVMHRGHGWTGGWAAPSYDRNDVGLLNNGSLLPVVISINCTSGNFDSGSNSIADAFLWQANGGAVAVIGDTNVSPTWANNALTRGLYDAAWPSFLPNKGSNKSIRRLGDMLNYAKLYMLTDAINPQPATGSGLSYDDVWRDVYLYHVIGDPTMEMWTEDPNIYPQLADNFKVKEKTDKQWTILYPEIGATLTVLDEQGQPMTRGIVQSPTTNPEGILIGLLLPAVQKITIDRDRLLLPAVQKVREAASKQGHITQPLREESDRPVDETHSVETANGRLRLTFSTGTFSGTLNFRGITSETVEIEGVSRRLMLVDGYIIKAIEPITPIKGIQIQFRIPLADLRLAGIDPHSLMMATEPPTSNTRPAFMKLGDIKGEAQVVDTDLIITSGFTNPFVISNNPIKLVLAGLPIQSHRVPPTMPSRIDWLTSQGLSTTLHIPAGALRLTTTLVYTPYHTNPLTIPLPSGIRFGQIFGVAGFDDDGNAVQPEPTVGISFTLTYKSTEPMRSGDIRLYRYDRVRGLWILLEGLGREARQGLLEQHLLTANVTEFGLILVGELASSSRSIYLPIVVKK